MDHCADSLPGQNYSAWPSSVATVDVTPGGPAVTVQGDLGAGACTHLGFADDSSVACFPGTQDANFQGNVVFYAVAGGLPAHNKLDITVTPNAGVDVSVFTYLTGTDTYYVPPFVPQVPNCEAVHDAGAGGPESVSIWNVAGDHNVLVGVAGTAGTTTGGFELRLAMPPAP